MTTPTALRTLISTQPGFGAREINGDLERLGLPIASIRDLHSIGGYVEPMTGVWALPETARSCSLATRMDRGEALEALSYGFGPAWQAKRNRLVMGWIRQDMRGSIRLAA